MLFREFIQKNFILQYQYLVFKIQYSASYFVQPYLCKFKFSRESNFEEIFLTFEIWTNLKDRTTSCFVFFYYHSSR